MTANKAKEIALEFMKGQDLRGYKMEFVEVRQHQKFPGEWTAVFDVYSAKGDLIDGPALVIVDEKTGVARAFESP